MLTATCAKCGQGILVPINSGGKMVKCPKCGARMTLSPGTEDLARPAGPRIGATQTLSPQQAQAIASEGGTAPLPVKFGSYQILGEISRGGMGVVYKAYDPNLKRTVALKVLLAAEHASKEDVERFFREASSAAKLQHPNIVPIHEIKVQEGRHYYTMDYIEGEPLDLLIAEKRLTVRQSLHVLSKVARALDHAHSRGVIHRDLKPGNIIIAPNGEPMVFDFGLAKVLAGEDQASLAMSLTHSGVAMGTPPYEAPEQAAGRSKEVDARTDVYALGCILYELLAGEPPFDGESAMVILRKHMEEDPIPPSRKGVKVPADVEIICLKCLEKDPLRRYQTAGELANDIERFLESKPIAARRASVAYVIQKKLIRHKTIAVVTAAAAITLVVATAWYVHSLRKTLAETEQARDEAKVARDQEALQKQAAESARNDAVRQKDTAEKAKTEALTAKDEAVRQKDAAEKAKADLLAAMAETDRQKVLALANKQAADAEAKKRRDAESTADLERKRAAEEQQRRLGEAYAANLGRAQRLLVEGNLDEVDQLLGACPESLRNWEWGWLRRKAHQELQTPVESNTPIRAVVFSPDGKLLAWGGDDKTLLLWDLAAGRQVGKPMSHVGPILAAAFSPDGKRLASGGGAGDSTVRLWDLRNCEALMTRNAHRSGVSCVAYSPDGKLLASGGADNMITLWNAETGQPLLSRSGFAIQASDIRGRGIRSVSFSPNGQFLAAGSGDKTIRIWETTKGTELITLVGHTEAVSSVAFAPAYSLYTRWLTSGGADGTIRTWNMGMFPSLDSPVGDPFDWDKCRANIQRYREQALLHTITGHKGAINAITISLNGRRLAYADGKTIRIWDREKDESVSLPGFNAPEARKETDVAEKASISGLIGHRGEIQCLALSPDGELLASGAEDGTVKLWNYDLSAPLRSSVQSLSALSPDDKRIARVTTRSKVSLEGKAVTNNRISIWDLEAKQRPISIDMGGTEQAGEHCQVLAVVLSTNGLRVAGWKRWGKQQEQVTVWDAETGKALADIAEQGNSLSAIGLSPDGRKLAVASSSRPARILDAETGRELTVLRGPNDQVTRFAFVPDKKTLVTRSVAGTVRAWDLETGGERYTLKGHASAVEAMFLSPGGRYLVTRDQGLQIVSEVETGREVLRNSRVRNAPNVAFSADEKQVAAFIAPDGLRVWDVAAGRVSLNLERLEKVFGDVFTLAFSPSEPVLATAGQLKGIALRDTRTGQVAREFGEMAGQIASIAFSPDGKRLASVGWRDGKIRMWEVSSGKELAVIAELPNLDLSPNEPCSLRFAPNGKMLVLEWGRATEFWFADDWKQPVGGADAKNGPAQARPNDPPQGRQPAK